MLRRREPKSGERGRHLIRIELVTRRKAKRESQPIRERHDSGERRRLSGRANIVVMGNRLREHRR